VLQPQSKPCLVITNPLHYTYLRRRVVLPAIGSSRNILLNESAAKLGFADDVTEYSVANSIEDLIAVDQQQGHNDRAYITWKADPSPYTFLGNSYKLAHQLEQKAAIRRLLPSELFPGFIVVSRADVPMRGYADLLGQLHTGDLVLQVDFSTGGRGTYFVSSQEAFDAIKPALIAAKQDIVVSKKIHGIARGIQGLISSTGVQYMRWWHQDLVNTPGVCSLDVPTATRYCGAVLENSPASAREQIDALMSLVCKKLSALGYSGVFGADIVVETGTGRIYLIEINPRFTAVSHVYATAMHAMGYNTDFLSTAVLEALGETDEHEHEYKFKRSLSAAYYYLKIQNKSNHNMRITDLCTAGVYEDFDYKRFGFGVEDIRTVKDCVVLPEGERSSLYPPGARMFSIIGMGEALHGDELTAELKTKIAGFEAKFLRSA
jgi:hypothetical protein